mgnify:CR=1 FL=1
MTGLSTEEHASILEKVCVAEDHGQICNSLKEKLIEDDKLKIAKYGSKCGVARSLAQNKRDFLEKERYALMVQ